MLIVVYNDIAGGALELPEQLPGDIEISLDRRRLTDADAVVFHVPGLRFGWRPRKPEGQIWVAWSLESDANYPKLRSRRFMANFELTMTYQRSADVLWGYVPYYASADNMERALAVAAAPKTADRPLAMFLSSGIDRSGRRRYARELARHIPIDSFGSFRRNRMLANDRGRVTKLETIARYPFTIAFENSIADDYVTEKFFDPLVVGSVPVYLGAENIADLAPGDGCYVDVRDYASPQALAEHLESLLARPAAYAELFAWKARPLRPSFRDYLDRQRTSPWLRLVRAIAERSRRCVPS